jgi:predicted ribosomally synthesized peptide with SipW-like signal peptide
MSSDNNMELSRRKILAGMGAVGAAGAGAGLGTSALFSDTEQFVNNQLTAGQLDLKMDWEEHYSFPQIYDDFEDPTIENGTDLDVVREDPNDSRYVGLPDPEDPVVWANAEDDPTDTGESSLELYFQNTTIEAYPDQESGEVEATFTSIDSGGNPVVENPCDALADVPQDLGTYSDEVDPPARTRNGDTYDSEDDEAYPLINLWDVKPGDFGEFTFSAHLCDNPGYLWLQMPDGLTESENGLEEPESDPAFGNDSSPDDGELAENVQTALWYDDDCNNRIDREPQDIVTLAVVDTSDSTSNNLQDIQDAANALVENLYDATQQNTDLGIWAGIITFENTGDSNDPILANPIVPVDNYVDNNGDGQFDGETFLPDNSQGGNSPIPQALDVGREYLNDKAAALDSDSSNDIEDPDKDILLVSDGNPVYDTSGGTDGVTGELLNPDESLFSFDGNNYESDYFDGEANESDLELPNPNSPPNSKDRAETALVARDIDGQPFVPNTQYSQPAGPKVDNPEDQPEGLSGNDPADISGDNDITVRAAAIYDSADSSGVKQLARDTMMAYASGDGAYYDVGMLGGTDAGEEVANDLVGSGGPGENVIFRGTLSDLENELTDPATMLDGNQEGGCFAPGATHCFGLAWWVPIDVGNEIQGDSVSFDLAFLTEQCRNNDDPGQTVL